MDLSKFQWMNESRYDVLTHGISIYAPKQSDFFVNPETKEETTTAPFLYTMVEGDFVCRAKVHHAFQSTYDACVLLAYEHESLWAKACFEFSDLNSHAIVSVMTNQVSDDANGVELQGDEVWLQLSRKGNMFAVHYSYDGTHYKMARLTNLPMSSKIKVGFEAQSPMGEGGMREFSDIMLESFTLEDIRDGNLPKKK